MYHFEIVKNKKRPWCKQKYHWRIRHYGDIIATSEMYHNFDDAVAVATHLQSKVKGATLKMIEK